MHDQVGDAETSDECPILLLQGYVKAILDSIS
jgi:hypothetical protein